MAFHYTDDLVHWSYHYDRPSDYNPSAAQLAAWDTALFESYDKDLTELLAEFDLPDTRGNKSRILQLALVSNGPSVRWKVRHACHYHVNVSS